MGKRTVKNYPSPRLMETIGATNQSTPEAIGELVANSFDARLGQDKLEIVIDLRDNQICVIDNGRGMTEDVLEKAVCIAEDMSQYIERGESAKGHFGMGFKTSCSTLGKFYEIYTRPAENDEEYHIEFDINEYSHRPSGADAWDVVIEDTPTNHGGPLASREHGTAFVISRLNDKNILTSAIIDYLGDAFKGHLISGDKIEVIDDNDRYPVTPKKRDPLPGTKIDIDVACGPKESLKITGWMALDRTIHNDGLYGFNIYRHGQLIDSWNKDWFKPHLMTSRVIGEVNMDFLDATFYKQGLQQSESWIIASKYMKEYLKHIVTASRNISRRGNIRNSSERKKIIATLRENYGLADNENEISVENNEVIDSQTKQPKKSINNKVKALIRENMLELKDGTTIPITLSETTSNERIKVPFDYLYEDEIDDNPTLSVVIYTDHPLFHGKENQSTIRILSTADAIFRVLIEKFDYSTGEAFNIKNAWINNKIDKGDERK
ncbi:MAG: ATP-binding protein [Coriobacteriales bacterium]|jgi:hypothetical protein